jgi:hypothetical protein
VGTATPTILANQNVWILKMLVPSAMNATAVQTINAPLRTARIICVHQIVIPSKRVEALLMDALAARIMNA